MTVVIDREGVLRYVIEGIMYSDQFDQKVRPLLLAQRDEPYERMLTLGYRQKNRIAVK